MSNIPVAAIGNLTTHEIGADREDQGTLKNSMVVEHRVCAQFCAGVVR